MATQQNLSSLRIDHDDDDDGKRDWASLLLDLLRTIASAPQLKRDMASKQAALASCKTVGRAVVQTSSLGGLRLDVDRRAKFVPSVQLWRELWGAEQPQQVQLVGLGLSSRHYGSPGRCWSEVLRAGERLPFVTTLVLQGLALDVMLPPGVNALLPNLREFLVKDCVLTPAARTAAVDTGCSRLQFLAVEALAARGAAGACAPQPDSQQQLAMAQLVQLARLPSLSSVLLHDSSCPTPFLVALGAQLTRLHLDPSHRRSEPGTQTPTPGWRATLQHIARCTRLRELHVPCQTAEELGLAAPALQQLRDLRLSDARRMQADGDAVVELLLGLPHLTSLWWQDLTYSNVFRSHADRPCRWERLTLSSVMLHQLARLPLHSLKQPVWWSGLTVATQTPMDVVRAAVANVTRRCPAGFRWAQGDATLVPWLAFVGPVDPAVLQALQPLFAPLTNVNVCSVAWDAGLVRALGEALPRTCTRLSLVWGSASREALEQVAHSLPWVQRVEFREQQVAPEDVVAYVHLARGLQWAGAAAPRLHVVVARPVCPQGVAQQTHRQAWEQAVREARQAGSGTVVVELVW